MMCLSGLFLLVSIKVIAVETGLKRAQITNNKEISLYEYL